MKGRFKTPIWVIPVLAMVVALGAYAVFAGINQFAASPAEADIQEAGKGLSATVDAEKLTEPLKTPLQEATLVVTGSASVNPERPGAATRLEVVFGTSAGSSPLNPGTGQIIIRLEDDFQVPNTLDRNQINISANLTEDGAGNPAGQSDSVAPQSVSVDFEGTENDEPEITLTVPDMIAGDSGTTAGPQSISPGATVTVVFSQAAGIMNPTEGTDYDVRVRTNSPPDDTLVVVGTVTIPVLIQLNSTGDPRGAVLTIVALGLNNGTTATFFRDTNGNGVQDAGESVLDRAVVDGDDTATINYTMSNPPFTPGRSNTSVAGNTCTGTFPGPVALVACNYINVFDGEGRTASQRNQTDLNRSIFELEPTIQVSPSSANTGDRVTVSLFDFTPNSSIPTDGTLAGGGITLGGVGVTAITGGTSVASNGQANFTMTIPAGVPLGVQRLDVVDDAGGAQDVTMTIGGASLNLSHQEVIANQDLTITGNGFTQGGNVCIPVAGQAGVTGGITLSNVPLVIDDSDDCDITVGGNNVEGREVTGGGSFTLTVRLEEQGTNNIPTALLTQGTHELKVIDTDGAEGTMNVTIAARTVEVNPLSARPRDVITVIGRNFIADNVDGLTASVQVEYDCGGGNNRSVTADVDVSGNFRETLRIPSNCTIPSTNTIRAEILANNVTTGVVDTTIHEIPDALIRIEPNRGPSGTPVDIFGEGFRTFDSVSAIRFGGRGTIGGRTINTDAQGDFMAEGIVVPGLDPGIHAVLITVGGEDDPNRVTSSTSFEVLERGVEGIPTDVLDAVEPLGDNLVRVFFFNNTTKEWTFFDPRPEFADANTLNEVNEGNPIWVRVNEDQQVDLNNEPRNLTCVNPGTPEEDCWNLIVW